MQPQQPSLSDLDNAPESLPVALEEPTADELATLKVRFQEVTAEKDALAQDFDTYRRRYKGSDALDEMIKPYAERIFGFMVGYCCFVGSVLLLTAGNRFPNPIDSTVMSFLVGSTATTVLGLVGMVVTGIFSGVRKSS